MNLDELRLRTLGVDSAFFGKIFSFVDFGNVNHWYHKDRSAPDGSALADAERLTIDINKLASFLGPFSSQRRFYYGWHPRMPKSQHLLIKADKAGFVKVSKPVQFIRHYVTADEMLASSARSDDLKFDKQGWYIEIAKGNFDVEISVDAVRLMDKYDTFCLLSGDADFVHLLRFLKRKHRKKIIVFASGHVLHSLKEEADLYINAQKVKPFIATVKTNHAPRGA